MAKDKKPKTPEKDHEAPRATAADGPATWFLRAR